MFIYSEISHITSTFKSPLAKHLEKVDILNIWMNHNKLNTEIKNRVNNYMNYVWHKFKGIDDQQIMKELPETV